VFVKRVDRVSGVGDRVSLDPDTYDTRHPKPETR
jgi:hypothetical protein